MTIFNPEIPIDFKSRDWDLKWIPGSRDWFSGLQALHMSFTWVWHESLSWISIEFQAMCLKWIISGTWMGRGGPEGVKGGLESVKWDMMGAKEPEEGPEGVNEGHKRCLRRLRRDLRGLRGDLRAHVWFMRWYEMISHDCAMITQWILKRYDNLKNEVIPMTTKLIAFVVKNQRHF